jgi:hypothetical protein
MQVARTQKAMESLLIGAGAGLAIVILLVLEAVFSGGMLGTKTDIAVITSVTTATTTTTKTSVSTIPSNDSLATPIILAFENHLLNIESVNLANLTDLMRGYTNNVTLLVNTKLPSSVNQFAAAEAFANDGIYLGRFNASIFVETFISPGFKFQGHDMTMRVLSLKVQNLNDGTAGNVLKSASTNSTVSLSGYSHSGNANATCILQSSYVQVGGTWLISNETWTITNYANQNLN